MTTIPSSTMFKIHISLYLFLTSKQNFDLHLKKIFQEKFKEMIRSIPVKKKFNAGSDYDFVTANQVNKVINTLADRADRLVSKYCILTLNDLVVGITVNYNDGEFDVENLHSEIRKVGRFLLRESENARTENGKRLANALLKGNDKLYDDYRRSISGLYQLSDSILSTITRRTRNTNSTIGN